MKYKEFIRLNWSESKAYILGLFFTRIDIGRDVRTSKKYLLGQIAHNSTKDPTEKERLDKNILSHLMNLAHILEKSSIDINDITIDNNYIKIIKDNVNKGRKSGKKGFVVAVELESINNDNLNQIKKDINTDLMKLVNNLPERLLPYLIAGTIDGRSSYDTTSKYVSIDIDRDYEKQNLIERKTEEYDFDVNINRREENHPKADQLRYRHSDIPKILSNIPLISDERISILKKR